MHSMFILVMKIELLAAIHSLNKLINDAQNLIDNVYVAVVGRNNIFLNSIFLYKLFSHTKHKHNLKINFHIPLIVLVPGCLRLTVARHPIDVDKQLRYSIDSAQLFPQIEPYRCLNHNQT